MCVTVAVVSVSAMMVAVIVVAIRSIIRTIPIIRITAVVVAIVMMAVIQSTKEQRGGNPCPHTPAPAVGFCAV